MRLNADIARSGAPSPLGQKVPRDARTIGWAIAVFGLILVMSGGTLVAGFWRFPGGTYTVVALFGALKLTSATPIGVNLLVCGALFAFGGYGLTRGRAYGWWTVLAMLAYGVPGSICVCYDNMRNGAAWLALILGAMVWLFARARIFSVFGGRQER